MTLPHNPAFWRSGDSSNTHRSEDITEMNHNRCGNCGGEQVVLGANIKCFDCGRSWGDDPTTEQATLAVANAVLTRGHDIQTGSEWTDEDGVFEYAMNGRDDKTRRVRCVAMYGGYEDDGDVSNPVPLVPGIDRELMKGVDEVGVLFVDTDRVVRYEAVPYHQRTHAQSSVGDGGATA